MSTYLFGPHAVEDALRSNRPIEVIYIADSRKKKEIEKLLSLAKELRVEVQYVPISFFNKIKSDKSIPDQGVAAKCEEIKILELKEWLGSFDLNSNPIVVIVDHIEDPHNFGALVRSSAAFNVAGFIFPKNRNATFGPAAERAASGGQNHVPLIKVSNIAETIARLRKNGFWVIGADSESGEELQKIELNKPVVLVFGSEHHGLHRLVRERCDQVVRIPTTGKIESLNVSVAAGLFLWEFYKSRF